MVGVCIRNIETCQIHLKKKGERENIGGVEPVGVHGMQIWKCHNQTPCKTNIY
jgi:hypothetical protein